MIRTLIFLLLSSIGTASFAQEPPQKETPKVVIKTQKKRGDAVNDSMYQIRIQESELDGMYIPKDLYDVFKELDKLMDEDATKTFMAYSDAEVDRKTHGSLGVWLEHKWSLSEGSRLSDYFRKMKVPHYDYMIGIIITSYHRHLHGNDLKIKEQVTFFREIWNKKQQAKAEELIQRGEVKE
jgi:hypothetical protein